MRGPASTFLNQHSYLVLALGVLVVAALASRFLRPRFRVALVGGGFAAFAAAFAVLHIGSGDIRGAADLDAAFVRGQPVVLEFYSNYCVACLGAKAEFEDLEQEFAGRAAFLRANIQSAAGRSLALRNEVDTVPTFLVFGPDHRVRAKLEGAPGVPVAELRRALNHEGR